MKYFLLTVSTLFASLSFTSANESAKNALNKKEIPKSNTRYPIAPPLQSSTAPLNVTLQIVGKQYAKPNQTTSFVATTTTPFSPNATTYLFEWIIDGVLCGITNSSRGADRDENATSHFHYKWMPDVLLGLHNVTIVVKARNHSGFGMRTIFIAVTNSSIKFKSTSPTLPWCSTVVTMETLNASSTFSNATLIYAWNVASISSAQETNRSDLPTNATFHVTDLGYHVFYADVIAVLNGLYYPLTSGNTTIEISWQLLISIGASLGLFPNEDLCPTCCATFGYVTFRAAVHDPTNCNKLGDLVFLWNFEKARRKKHGPSWLSAASPFYPESSIGTSSYSLEVTHKREPQHPTILNGTICIEEPVGDLTIVAPSHIQKKQLFNVTVFCSGSHPVSYCYVTCESAKEGEKCTHYISGNATISIRLEKPGECNISITAKNNASHVNGVHKVIVRDTNNIPKTVSYTVPAVLGVIITVVLVVALAAFYYQYKAYRRRHIEVADFDYLGRDEPPSLWERLKVSVKSRLGLPTPARRRAGSGVMSLKRYGSMQQQS